MLDKSVGHKNKKFGRYHLGDYFMSNGKSVPAYMVNRDTGQVVRRFEKTNKKYRRMHEQL